MLHFQMLAALAQFERKLIAERVRAGLEAAWASGSVSGRKRLDDDKHSEKLELARTLVRGGKNVTAAAKAAGIGRSTLCRYLEGDSVSKTLASPRKGRRNSGTDLETVSRGVLQNGAAH